MTIVIAVMLAVPVLIVWVIIKSFSSLRATRKLRSNYTEDLVVPEEDDSPGLTPLLGVVEPRMRGNVLDTMNNDEIGKEEN